MKHISIFRSAFIPSLLLLLFNGVVNLANAQTSRIDVLCAKIQTCAVSEFEKQGLPPATIATMKPLFDNMCTTVINNFNEKIAGKPQLEEKSDACIDSFIVADCASLIKSQGNYNSPACEEFKQAAEAAGIDTEKVGEEAASEFLNNQSQSQ